MDKSFLTDNPRRDRTDSNAPLLERPSRPRTVSVLSSVTDFRPRNPNCRVPRRRLITKSGECNITHTNISELHQRYLADIFTTLVDIEWSWYIIIFILSFVATWLGFGVSYYIVAYSNGDLDNKDVDDWTPCVTDVTDFTSALLFSIETQHTIGYGSRYITEECPEAIFLMMAQSCAGVIIQALLSGVMFLKLSRPNNRAQTLLFSRHAVICLRDGQLRLLFRLGNIRKSHIIEAHTRGILIKRRKTAEGEIMPFEHIDVQFGSSQGSERVFLIWPIVLEHTIDSKSPFYNLSCEDLTKDNFELVVMLEGVNESTGMSIQAVSSYLSSEIIWGHRFERLVTYVKNDGEYNVDYARFHSTVPVSIPCCSAADLEVITKLEKIDEKDEESDIYKQETIVVKDVEEISETFELQDI